MDYIIFHIFKTPSFIKFFFNYSIKYKKRSITPL